MSNESDTSLKFTDELSRLQSRVSELESALAVTLKDKEVLQEREAKYQRIVENISDVIFEIDPHGVVLYISPAGKRIWGYDPEDVIGKNVSEFVHPDDLDIIIRRFLELGAGTGKPLSCRIRNKSGEFRWVRTKTKPRIVDGTYISAYGTIIDITDLKRAEEALRDSEERYRSIFENAPLGIFHSTREGKLVDANSALAKIYGYDSVEDLISEVNRSSVAEKLYVEKEKRSSIVEEVESAGKWKGYVNQYRKKDGSIIDATLTFRRLPYHDSRGAELEGFVEDITARRKTEGELKNKNEELHAAYEQLAANGGELEEKYRELEKSQRALRESEELAKSILKSVPHGLFGVEKRSIFFVNDAMEDVFGWKPEELVGKSTKILFRNDEEWKEYGAMLYTWLRKMPVVTFEANVPFVRRDGTEILCRNSVSRTGDELGITNRIVATFEDITERKRAEEALKRSEQQQADIIDFLPDATLAIDNEKRIIIWNRAIEEMTGIPAREMLGKGDYAYTIPFYGEARPQLMDLVLRDNEELAAKYSQIRREGDTLVAEAFCHALYNNKGAWVYLKATPLRDQSGNIKGVIEIIRDITEQRSYEEALKNYQRNLADIINFLPDATFVIDKDGIVTAWNNAIASMTGIKAEKMIGKGNYEYALPFYGERRPIIIDLILSADDEFLRKSYDAIQSQEAVLSGEVYVPQIFGGKGAYLWGNASRLYNANGEIIGAIQSIRDISERRQAEAERRELEERLQRAEKMESLGLLAGGVAHDLNNVLGIVVGYAEMLVDEMDKSNPMQDDLKKILDGGNRSAAIVQDLLTLARRGVQSKKTVNLNAVIADCQKTPEFEKVFSYNPRVKLTTDLETDLLNITGSPVHLVKTIINLASNAVEAMPNGGVLKIATANQYLDTPIHGYDNIREGDYVVLTVSDTGEGIPERDIKRIFEPFYTKKIMGRSGTGLGLAVVWGTIKDHNGYINVESEEGKGTVFTLYFPVTREDADSDRISASMAEYMGKGEAILVVDDIKGQRELASRMLTKLNYRVSTVASGEDAVEYVKTNKTDLLVLDMIMDPGMDGLETYEKVLEINPTQKAVIVSGFSESDRVREAQKLGAGAYVRKPYVLERLGTAVRKELDRK